MIKVTINNICAKLTECEPLTSGMIGKLVEVSFSSEWSGLNKIAVFSNGDVTKDLYESQWNGNYIPIPQEVLATPHRTISMGIYGYEIVDGEKVLAIPTIVAEIGKTKFGADPSDDPAADPTLPIWAQLQWEIDHFEIDEQQIAEQVQAYLAEHPIEIQPATASVLGGIKVGANLSITADGTLSADAPDLDGYATEQWVEDKGYLTEHQSLAAYRTAAAQDIIDNSKQDAISDLATIRSGAALGATALQSVPNTYALKTDLPTKTSDLTNDSNFVNQDYVADVAEGLQDQIDDIEAVISTQATPTNKLVSASEMGDAISAVEAKQLYATSSQGSFATKAQLLSATTFYNADGTVATPTKNDIAYVLADESHSGKSAKYVVADITVSGIVWGFVITFSDTTFSQAQMDAINSGVTQQKVSAYDSHITDKSNPHEVTYQQLSGTNPSYTKGETDTLLDGKQSTISDLATIRSGAALGATALQSVPNTYALKTDLPTKTSDLVNDSGFLDDSDTEEAEQIEIDSVITEGSTNLITSGAVYAALGNVEAAINAIRGVV